MIHDQRAVKISYEEAQFRKRRGLHVLHNNQLGNHYFPEYDVKIVQLEPNVGGWLWVVFLTSLCFFTIGMLIGSKL